jgi:hypothetical protein
MKSVELAPAGWLSILRVAVVGIALLLAPGWLLQSLTLPKSALTPLSRVPISFAFSVSSIALLGVVSFFLHADLHTVQVLFLAWFAGLAAVWLWQARRGQVFPFIFPHRSSEYFWPSVAVSVFAVLCAVLALYGGGWLSHTADGFYHLAAIRRQIETGTPLPQGLFFVYQQAPQSLNVTAGTWHLVMSMFSLWSRVDITWLWWHLPVLISPLLVLSFYSLAHVLFRKPWLALFCTMLQFVLYDRLDFRVSVYPNQVGFILLWSALILTWIYLDCGSWRELVLIGILAVVMVSWHLLIAEFFLVALGSYFLLRLLVLWATQASLRDDLETRRLLAVLLPVAAVGVPFLFHRLLAGDVLLGIEHWLTVSPRSHFRSSVYLGHGFSIVGPLQLYKVDPRWRFAPMRFALWLFAYLLSLFLIPACLKRKRFALFLFATTMVVPLVFLNPFLITFLQGKVNDIGIIRLVLLPPYGLILGWFFWEQGHKWLRSLFSLPPLGGWFRGNAWKSVAGLVLAGAAIPLIGFVVVRQGADNLQDLYSPTSEHTYSIVSTHRQMQRSDQAPYEFLIDHSTPGTVVASDPEHSYYLGGLTGRSVVAVSPSHDPPSTGPSPRERRQDSVDILDSAVGLDETIPLLDKYDVCLVWVDSRMQSVDPVASRRKFASHPELFELVFADRDVSIYYYGNHETGCLQ